MGRPVFTQRSLRRAFITKAIELGLDFKVIAKTQGHSDGGVLVAKTYGHLREERLEAMAAKMV
jgi:site-specific recombinase XerD